MERSTIVRVQEGLHARPATRFVSLAKSFESDITVFKGEKSASAKSSVKLMLLGVKEGDRITVRVEGAAEATEALIAYLENPLSGLDEEDAEKAAAQPLPETPNSPSVEGVLHGVPASAGTALGPAFAYFPPEIRPQERTLSASEIITERERFDTAVERVRQQFDASLSADIPAGDRTIITALREISDDEELARLTVASI